MQMARRSFSTLFSSARMSFLFHPGLDTCANSALALRGGGSRGGFAGTFISDCWGDRGSYSARTRLTYDPPPCKTAWVPGEWIIRRESVVSVIMRLVTHFLCLYSLAKFCLFFLSWLLGGLLWTDDWFKHSLHISSSQAKLLISGAERCFIGGLNIFSKIMQKGINISVMLSIEDKKMVISRTALDSKHLSVNVVRSFSCNINIYTHWALYYEHLYTEAGARIIMTTCDWITLHHSVCKTFVLVKTKWCCYPVWVYRCVQ